MFVGRKEEIKVLLETFENPGKHTIVYGNRRVGKTELVTTSAKRSGYLFITYECLKSSLKNNLNLFQSLLYEFKLIPEGVSFDGFIDLFKYINSLGKHIIILIDEYPYLYYKEDKNEVDSIFQNILDKYASNLNIVFSGSHIGMMKDLLREGNPIFGRTTTIIHLSELNYLESNEFYKNLSPYDKVAFYSVFGGSPYILQQIDESKSLKENVCALFLNTKSSIYSFVSEGYTTDLATRDSANQLFQTLGNSKLKHNRIEELLHYDHNGLLSKQLKILLDMEFIDKNIPINKMNDSKKMTYFIKNNALRFYFTFIYGRTNILSLIGANAFFDRYISNGLNTFISYRFENIVKTYFSLMVKTGKLNDIYNIGTYYYDDPISKTNGEFDVVLETKDGFDIVEAKYLKDKVNKEIIDEEIVQISKIKELNIKRIGFASINGFDNAYPVKYLITGNDIYNNV